MNTRFALPLALPRVGLMLLFVCGCGGRSVGGIRPTDGSVSRPDASYADASPYDAGPVGCRPQDAREDPDIACEVCMYCEDRTPYRWTGEVCVFEPICCACLGADCPNRYRTYGDCIDARADCPRIMLEVLYPEARLVWHMPGGVAGWGPALMLDGFGHLRTWNELPEGADWDAPDPDYVEELGIHAANEIFSMLSDVDYTNLPHDVGPWSECYPSLWVRWEGCQGCLEIQLDYLSALELLPEFQAVYDWFDLRLCRGQDIEGYPWTLPSRYCIFRM